MSIINRQSLIGKVYSRYLHSPGSHQSTRFLESLTHWLTDWLTSLLERLVTLKIFPWIADSFSFSICASLSNCAAVQWVYFHLWSLILFHLISGDCWPTYCEIFKKNSCLDIVAFLVAEINHFRKFICLFYAVCLCVNGPSNRLHGRMQSRTGCICLTFLHCVFLNAVSDCLHYMKYNHTCCMVTCGDGFSPECILCALSKHSQKSYIYHTNYS